MTKTTASVPYGMPKISASRAALLFGTALGVSIAVFAATPQQAWAADECGADVGGIAVCTNVGNPYAAGIDYVGDAGEDITVVLLGGGLAPNIVTGAAQDGVTATASAGFDATIYTYVGSSIDATLNGIEVDASTGNAYVDANGTIDASLAGINAYSFLGNTYVTNTGDINADGLAAGRSQGIYAYSDGYTSVVNSGALTVTEASGSLAIGIFAETYDGDAVVDNSGIVDVTNTVGSAYGLVGLTDFGGDVTITGSADITVSGAAVAGGIFVSAYDYATVDQTGDIDVTATAGAGRGVDVTSYYDASVTVTGSINVAGGTSAYGVEVDVSLADLTADVTVNVTGDITAAAGSSYAGGVDVYAAGDVSITVGGTIATSSVTGGAYGIFAVSYYGDVTVATGNITADGAAGGAGIDVFAGGFDGAGEATITAGDIAVTGDDAEGVDADAIFGGVTIDVGNVSTAGADAEGIDVYAYLNSDITAGDVSTTGDYSIGVNSYSFLGDTNISVGNVSTTGAGSALAGSFGIDGYSLNGSTTITAGDVSTAGDYSEGVAAYGYTGASFTSTGTVSTTGYDSSGVEVESYNGLAEANVVNVNTAGDYSDAVNVFSYNGNAEITATGVISTAGNYSDGLDVFAYNGDGTVTNSADIDTAGNFSTAIEASSFNGSLTVSNTGELITGGDYSYGINAYTVNLGSGDVTVTNSGDITTAGFTAGGIRAFSYDGVATVNNTGHIETSGDYATGIYGYGYDGVHIYNDSDTVVTSGYSAIGILAFSLDSYVYVSSGTVNTTGDASDGIQAVSLGGDSTDYVTVYSDVITTSGLASDGIVAIATGGDVLVDSGTIDTLGDDAYGIYAYSLLGNISVTSDAITTAGANAEGIDAYAFLGYTTVVSGTVDTLGDDSYGIYAYGYLGANVTSDAVTTAGANSNGIAAISFFNAVTVDSGTVSTTGDYSIGVLAHGYGGTTVTSDSVTTTGFYSEGIVAIDVLGPTSVVSGSVETSGDYATGIRAGSFYDVTVDSGTVVTHGESAIGIEAYSLGGAALGDGPVSVTFDSVTTYGDAYYQSVVVAGNYNLYYYADSSHGISATSVTGAVSVVGYDVTTYGTGAEGIIADGFGDVYVNVDDVVTHGGALVNVVYTGPGTPFTDYYRGAVGIEALVTGGNVTVYADSVTTYGYEATGIVAIGLAYYAGPANIYSGDTTVSVNTVLTYGDGADGILAINYGANTYVSVNSVTTWGDDADGIVAAAFGYYDSAGDPTIYGDVHVNASFVTTHGEDAFGVYAAASAGNAIVDVYAVHTYGDGATGIYAAAFNYYDSAGVQNLQGDVDVDVTFVTTEGDGANAIEAYAEGGNIDIDAFVVTTYGDNSAGIYATAAYYLDPVLFTYYSGNVDIEVYDIDTSGDFSNGIDAYAAGGNVSIYAGNVEVFGIGSNAIVATTGGLDVNNTDNVDVSTYGTIYAYDGVGISVNSAGYSDIYVNSGSVFGYVWGIQSASVNGTYIYNDGRISGGFGAAIDVDGGAAEILNYGQIYGYVDLTGNADYVYNANLWEAYGYSDFGAGVDVVVNEDVVGFGRDGSPNSYTRFAGLEFFDNYALVSGLDGEVGDYLYIDGNFFGGAGSELAIDVELGGPGSAADVLVIGSASGVTEILPTDLLAGQFGALNFGGILVVDSANAAETGAEFEMANIDKGWIEYELFFDAANDDWLIVGLPDDEVFELLGAMSSSQDFWRRSGDAMSARWQELRDEGQGAGMNAGAGGVGAGRSEGWELWMQAHGGDEGFDNVESFAIGGFTFAQDLRADSDWRGLQFGFDNLSGNFLWGLTMGFNQQETTFDFDHNSFDTEGWNVGGYVGWGSGGFFMNALVKGDFFEQDANFHTLPSIFTFDGVTWGIQGELGYRWDGDGFFFEPLAQLAWSTTDLDSVSTAGADIDFDDAESLRGKFGARIGGNWGSSDMIVTPYIGAYYIDEWEGDNSLTFTTGITSITFADQGRGSYGQAEFGMTFQSFYGLEGFVKGEWNFGGDADGGAARLGARWRW